MKKLHFYWRDDMEYMVFTAQTPYIGLNYPDIPGANAYKGIVIWGKGNYVETHMTKEAYGETVELGGRLLNPKYARKHFEESEKLKNEYDSFITETRKIDVSRLDNGGLIKLLKRLWALQSKGMAFFSASQNEPLLAAEERLRELIGSKFSGQETNRIIETLLVSEDFDKAQHQEFDWADLVQSRDELTKEDFIAHGLKYPFIFRNNYDVERSVEYMKKRFEEDKKKEKELSDHISKLRADKKRIIKRQKKLLSEINDKEVNYLSWLFQRSALERMSLKYTWAGVEDFLFYELFLEVARRIGEDYRRMLDYYRPDDIVAALEGRGRLSNAEVENREKAVLLGTRDNEVFFYSGLNAIEEAKRQYPELFEAKSLDELKGTSACLGKAIGEVVIVPLKGLEDIFVWDTRFKEGQILVTAMTQPNMVPLMKKAGAIVTDEGGLTSHAAVISREFGKPCVVGTHWATQVFKTGDLVEVDANKGVVKLIRRKGSK